MCLQPPPLIIYGDHAGQAGDRFAFGWSGKSRPHNLAEPVFQHVCPRNSRYIWHNVEGEMACTPQGLATAVRVIGSRFPSHRVFVDGVVQGDVPQGDFGLLWDEDPSDPTMVR
jgi:hypothetical protein